MTEAKRAADSNPAPFRILVLTDGRPGHENQSMGICDAISTQRCTEVLRVEVDRVSLVREHLCRIASRAGMHAFATKLAGTPQVRDPVDLIVSAGGRTLLHNVLLARSLGCANIFSGSIRRFAEDDFTLILHIDPDLAGKPRHLVTLKPGRAPTGPPRLAERRIGTAILLLGGPVPGRVLTDKAIQRIAAWVRSSTIHWKVAPSRRTPPAWRAAFDDELLLDERTTSATDLIDAMTAVDCCVVTPDSTSMISEAVLTGRPVAVLRADHHATRPDDAYLDTLRDRGLIADLPTNELTDDGLRAAVEPTTPLAEPFHKTLGKEIEERLKL